DEVITIELDQRKIITKKTSLLFDYLILAVGSETNFFQNEMIEKYGYGLKDLQEAQAIRNHILTQYEKASLVKDEEEKKSLLTFVVVGGGPTGVEMAGAISELIRVLHKDYPDLDRKYGQVILLEGLERLLTNLSEKSSQATEEALAKKGVQVRFGAMVQNFDGKVISLNDGDQIFCNTLIWAAGVQAAKVVNNLSQEKVPQKRVKVLSTLQLPQNEKVFLIGDAAYLEDASGFPLPMVAPVAMQQADHAVKNLMRLIEAESLLPFSYRDMGSMATIGRNQAVAELFGLRLHGWLAWLTWLFVHLMQLVGFRNRLVVLINWAWQYLFYDRAVRLIETIDCE
ncbi:MAG TPA: FAD-dependent oxidoreductase, partial [Anaerolineaceae bacterium]|nr:FAD-dependent oxidoreductase [Anaerolineaceae bacterium]